MSEHIGKILQEKLNEPGSPTVQDFAGLLGISVRKVYHLYKGEADLTINEVVKASEILKVDLISEFLRSQNKLWLLKEPSENYRPQQKEVSITLHLSAGIKDTENFPELLDEINGIVTKHGFRLR